jgi:hypothetical protein
MNTTRSMVAVQFLIGATLVAACGGGGSAPGSGGAGAGSGGAGSGGAGTGGMGAPGDKRGEILIYEGLTYHQDLGGQLSTSPRPTVAATIYGSPFPRWHQEVMNDGTCLLKTYTPQQCDQFCEGACVGRNVCEPFPPTVSAGMLTFTGLKGVSSLSPDPSLGRYNYPTAPPNDLFDAGAAVTVTAAGAAVPPFTLQAKGVPPIEPEIQNGRFRLTNGQDYTLRWQPAAGGPPEARVRLTVNSRNLGHGVPYLAIIECDVPDAPGQLTVPRAMIDVFPRIEALGACVGVDCPPSFITRYTRGTAAVPGGHVDLLVGYELAIGIDHMP